MLLLLIMLLSNTLDAMDPWQPEKDEIMRLECQIRHLGSENPTTQTLHQLKEEKINQLPQNVQSLYRAACMGINSNLLFSHVQRMNMANQNQHRIAMEQAEELFEPNNKKKNG